MRGLAATGGLSGGAGPCAPALSPAALAPWSGMRYTGPMNVEFHYYAIHALALEAGFGDADAAVLASASQYVDASTTPLAFDAPRGAVRMAVTQNYVFWDESIRRDVYLPFHFLPGDAGESSARRADGTRNAYAVTPNGETARELLVAALKERDLYLIGIALHSFADTWAHQNFSGLLEEWNDLDSRSGAFGLPPAGHLQAMTSPDDPARVWEDPRLVPGSRRVVNRERFMAAAKKIFRYLRVYLRRPFDDEDLVLEGLASIWSSPSAEERVADCTIKWGTPPWDPGAWRTEAGAPPDRSPLAGIRHYDKLAWAKSELSRGLSREEAPIRVDSSFYASSLYHWHEAAMEHRSRAQSMLERRGL